MSPILTTLKCTGTDCPSRTTCVRFLAPWVTGIDQRLMEAKPNCDEYWEAKPETPTPEPKPAMRDTWEWGYQ